jgi:hypothetical protein
MPPNWLMATFFPLRSEGFFMAALVAKTRGILVVLLLERKDQKRGEEQAKCNGVPEEIVFLH